MHRATVSRREFLDILERSYPGAAHLRHDEERGAEIGGPELSLMWRDERQYKDHLLPCLVAIPRNSQKDFFAWAFTYVSALRPFTAFIRVVDPTLLEVLDRSVTVPSLGRLSEAFIALIIGEAISYLEPHLDLRQLSSNACANTHSYALARATALGFGDRADEVSAAWSSLGELTRQTRRHIDLALLRAPFQVLYELQEEKRSLGLATLPIPNLVREACRELLNKSDIGDHVWHQLTDSLGGLFDVRAEMQGTRESRVRAFDKASEWLLTNRRVDPVMGAFMCGYVGSRIAPGDLDHLPLVSKMLPIAPSAILWFSLCSGLQSRGQVSAFADGLGRRILRDLEQSDDLLGRPRCDVALAELELLSLRDKPLTDFRTASNGILTVELIPTVTTTIRWQRTAETQSELFDRRESSPEARNLVRELSFALERVEIIRRQLAHHFDLDPDNPTQSRSDKKTKRR